ncbi:MAG: hypothetical protein LAO04_21985 [Acidobacteriia bacterium]|nr:hypothetical protein [Terriglobia bacterium]
MAKEGERYIFTAEKASGIRNALSVLLAGVESEGDVTHSARERLEEFMKDDCDGLILDLRGVEVPPNGVSPVVRNVRASHVGRVLVITGEVTDPQVFRQLEELDVPHFPLKYMTTGLRTFAHALF